MEVDMLVPFSEVLVGENFSTHNSPLALYMKIQAYKGMNAVRISLTKHECDDTPEKGGHLRFFEDEHLVLYSRSSDY
jgi:hypothetical protein